MYMWNWKDNQMNTEYPWPDQDTDNNVAHSSHWNLRSIAIFFLSPRGNHYLNSELTILLFCL